MKKYILSLIFLCFALLASLASAEASGPDFLDVKNVEPNDVLNIREMPNWKSRKVGGIPHNGTCLQPLQCVGGLKLKEYSELTQPEREELAKKKPLWCQVVYENTVGWISAKFTKESHSDCSP